VIELGGIRLAEGRPIWLHAFGFGRYQHPEHGALEFTRARLGPASDVGGGPLAEQTAGQRGVRRWAWVANNCSAMAVAHQLRQRSCGQSYSPTSVW
jgi:hypothetical protein